MGEILDMKKEIASTEVKKEKEQDFVIVKEVITQTVKYSRKELEHSLGATKTNILKIAQIKDEFDYFKKLNNKLPEKKPEEKEE